MAVKFSNNASATLASSINNSVTTIAVTSGQGALFPSLAAGEFFFATLVDSSNNLEIVKVTARAADSLTVTRAQDGTSARAYTAGDRLELRPVAASFDTMAQTDKAQTFSAIQTFSQTIVGSINGNAATVTDGVYISGSQTITGAKTFSGGITSTGVSSLTLRSPGDLDTTGAMYVSFQDSSTGSSVERGWIGFGEANGNLGMSNAVSGKPIKFYVSGGNYTMDASGNFTASGNVTAYSDERLKKDWAPVGVDFVSKLAQVKSGTYTRIDGDLRQAGVSAQSLQEVLPETVMEDIEGTLSVAYGNAALVSAVELAREVVELKKRLEALEAK